ncbi:MAG TPA: PDZ domain-containing protein [Candidatus Eisenbacteria bacterium]|nr:PDZ domain-containing protein [Candidatus Eisenbacteria bacterium]
MRNFSARVPAAGVLAGLVCLILATPPAFAQRDDEDQGTPPRVRVYHDDDDNGPSASGGGYLGVRVQEITRDLQRARDLPSTQGALVSMVADGSPADQAGIRRGDVIVRVDGNEITDPDELIREMKDEDAGAQVRVVVLRDGSRRTIDVTLGRRPASTDVPPAYRRPPTGDYGELQRRLTALETQQRRLEEEIRALREELRVRNGGRDRDDD